MDHAIAALDEATELVNNISFWHIPIYDQVFINYLFQLNYPAVAHWARDANVKSSQS